MSGNISVGQFNQAEKTWTVTKDGQTFTVTDTNNNGIWDSKDSINVPTGSTLSSEDLYEAQYQANAQNGVTQEEMQKYAEFTKLREARDKAEQQAYKQEIEQKYAALQKAKPQKQSWIDKTFKYLDLGTNFVIKLASGAAMVGMAVDMFKGGGDWQYNGCCNDNRLWSFSNMSNAMLAMSTMSSMMLPNISAGSLYASNNNMWSSLGLDLSNSTTKSTASTASTAQTTLDNWLAAQTKTEKQEETEYKETQKAVNTLNELVKDKREFIPDSNETLIDQLISCGKTEYTEEDKANIDKLTKFTYIPLDLIGDGADKLSEQQAENINKIIRNHVKCVKSDSNGLANYTNGQELSQAYKELNDAIKARNIDAIIKAADKLNAIKPELAEKQDEEQV